MKKYFFAVIFTFLLLTSINLPTHANNYTYIHSGDSVSNHLQASSDVHWYQFNTTEDNSDINIYLSNTTAPMYFEIYNGSMQRLDYSLTSYYNSLKADTYYVKVYASSWGNTYSKGSYELKATYQSGQVTHNAQSLEPNDTRENAFPLKSGSKISSQLSHSRDYDFYKVSTNIDNGDLYIYLANTTAPMYFEVYDENKRRLDYSISSYYNRLKAGTYYIKVYSSGWSNQFAFGNYDLIATYSTPTVSHNTTTFEPNDTRENAFAIKSNVAVKSELSNSRDIDVYSITLNATGYVNVALSNTSAPTRFAIYDANKNRLDYALSSYNRQLAAGTYYIEVTAGSWGDTYSNGTYTLTAGFPNTLTKSNHILLYLNNKKAYINGNPKTLAVAPFTKSETTLVPLRFVSEELGAKVDWNSKNGEITVLLDGTKITLTTTSYYVYVNGYSKRLQVKPEIINGTTFVPLRFVSEELGKSVQWNQKNKSITIK